MSSAFRCNRQNSQLVSFYSAWHKRRWRNLQVAIHLYRHLCVTEQKSGTKLTCLICEVASAAAPQCCSKAHLESSHRNAYSLTLAMVGHLAEMLFLPSQHGLFCPWGDIQSTPIQCILQQSKCTQVCYHVSVCFGVWIAPLHAFLFSFS